MNCIPRVAFVPPVSDPSSSRFEWTQLYPEIGISSGVQLRWPSRVHPQSVLRRLVYGRIDGLPVDSSSVNGLLHYAVNGIQLEIGI